MATENITDSNFRDVYQNNDIVILDFWASWCGPCHQFAPIFEAASSKHSDCFFGKVNTEEEENLSAYFSIRSIPTIIVIRGGIEVFRNSGVLAEADLSTVIEKVKALDMAELSQNLDKEESS